MWWSWLASPKSARWASRLKTQGTTHVAAQIQRLSTDKIPSCLGRSIFILEEDLRPIRWGPPHYRGNLLYSKFTHLQVTLTHRNTITETSRIIRTTSVSGMMASPIWQEINCHNQERHPWGAINSGCDVRSRSHLCKKLEGKHAKQKEQHMQRPQGGKLYKLTGGWGSSEPWYQEVSRADANGRAFFLEKETGSWSVLHTPLHQTTNPQSHILLWEVGWKQHFQAATQKEITRAFEREHQER